MFNFPTSYTADFPLQITARPILGRGAGTLIIILNLFLKLIVVSIVCQVDPLVSSISHHVYWTNMYCIIACISYRSTFRHSYGDMVISTSLKNLRGVNFCHLTVTTKTEDRITQFQDRWSSAALAACVDFHSDLSIAFLILYAITMVLSRSCQAFIGGLVRQSPDCDCERHGEHSFTGTTRDCGAYMQ